MDEKFKVHTPEKVILKEASVVLTKLGQGDIPSGLVTTDSRNYSKSDRSPGQEREIKQLNTNNAKGNNERKNTHDAPHPNFSSYAFSSPIDSLRNISSVKPDVNEQLIDLKFPLTANKEDTGASPSSPSPGAKSKAKTRTQGKTIKSPGKKHSPRKSSNFGAGFKSNSVQHDREKTQNSPQSNSHDAISHHQSSSDLSVKPSSMSHSKISPTKSFITDMVTSPSFNRDSSEGIASRKSSITRTDSYSTQDKKTSETTRVEIDCKDEMRTKSKNALEKLSVFGCSTASKTMDNDRTPYMTKSAKEDRKYSPEPINIENDSMKPVQHLQSDTDGLVCITTFKSNINQACEKSSSTSERQRTVPSILSRSKSKVKAPTVRELLQRERSQMKIKNIVPNKERPELISYHEIPYLQTDRNKIIPTTIPPKRASTSMSVIGKSADMEEPKSCKKGHQEQPSTDKPLMKRYKNTRYSVPFSGPSIVIPKNYDPCMAYSFSSVLSSSPSLMHYKSNSDTTFLPKLTETSKPKYTISKKDMGISFLPSMNKSRASVSSLTNITGEKEPTSNTCETLPPSPCLSQYSKFMQPDRNSVTPSAKQTRNSSGKLPDLQIKGTSQFNSVSNSTYPTEAYDQGQCIIIEPNTLSSAFNPSDGSIRHQKNQRKKLDIPVYEHPVVGRLREYMSEPPEATLQADADKVHNNLVESPVGPMPSHTSLTPCGANHQTKTECDGCFYCDIEKILQNIDNASFINMSDHAYTKTPPSSPSQWPQREGNDSNPHISTDFQTMWANAGGGNMPVLTVKCGDNVVLIPKKPYADSPASDKGKTKQIAKQAKTALNNKRPSIIGDRKKRILKKKIEHERKRSDGRSSRKLEFVRIVNLSPTKICKQKQSNLEKVISCLRKQALGNNQLKRIKDINHFTANTIQIERSSDDIFTHVTNTVCITFLSGEDMDLKRWHDFEDYYVRLIYDNVSGAISHIECDTLKPGFYRITKTGMSTTPGDQQTKTMATLTAAIPCPLTILNDNVFISIGKLHQCSATFPPQLPANIQKHTHLGYLMSALSSVTTVMEDTPFFSDRSYLPKADAGTWYSGQSFDTFTRHYHRKRKVMSGFGSTDVKKESSNYF